MRSVLSSSLGGEGEQELTQGTETQVPSLGVREATTSLSGFTFSKIKRLIEIRNCGQYPGKPAACRCDRRPGTYVLLWRGLNALPWNVSF